MDLRSQLHAHLLGMFDDFADALTRRLLADDPPRPAATTVESKTKARPKLRPRMPEPRGRSKGKKSKPIQQRALGHADPPRTPGILRTARRDLDPALLETIVRALSKRKTMTERTLARSAGLRTVRRDLVHRALAHLCNEGRVQWIGDLPYATYQVAPSARVPSSRSTAHAQGTRTPSPKAMNAVLNVLATGGHFIRAVLLERAGLDPDEGIITIDALRRRGDLSIVRRGRSSLYRLAVPKPIG